MLDTIRSTFPGDIAFTDPSGGLFTWLTFPEGFDAATFMLERALPEAKVAYVPGATFFPIAAGAEPRQGQLLDAARRRDRAWHLGARPVAALGRSQRGVG